MFEAVILLHVFFFLCQMSVRFCCAGFMNGADYASMVIQNHIQEIGLGHLFFSYESADLGPVLRVAHNHKIAAWQ